MLTDERRLIFPHVTLDENTPCALSKHDFGVNRRTAYHLKSDEKYVSYGDEADVYARFSVLSEPMNNEKWHSALRHKAFQRFSIHCKMLPHFEVLYPVAQTYRQFYPIELSTDNQFRPALSHNHEPRPNILFPFVFAQIDGITNLLFHCLTQITTHRMLVYLSDVWDKPIVRSDRVKFASQIEFHDDPTSYDEPAYLPVYSPLLYARLDIKSLTSLLLQQFFDFNDRA